MSTDRKEKKKEKLLREVIVKIELKQEDDEDGITVEALLDSSMIELVMSWEFVRKNKFKKKKLEMLWSQNLKVDQEKESCIGLIQENSIENSV